MDHHRTPELPTLDRGLTLLETDDRATGAVQSLVLDHVLCEGGPAVWVDADGHGTTRPLARVAPRPRVLDRIHIARAFTPWQHISLLRDLDAGPTTPSLLVLPAIDAVYRIEDLGQTKAKRLFADGLERVATFVDERDIPALVTRQADDDLTRPLAEQAAEVLSYEVTPLGPRFSGEDYETLVYQLDDGLVQTTLAFWTHVLEARHPQATPDKTAPRLR